MSHFPRLVEVHQRFDRTEVSDPGKRLTAQLEEWSSRGCDLQGKSVAVAAGSRGITGGVEIIRVLISFLKKEGARPFLIPAMGSHGGATGEGQEDILRRYGLTEDSLGIPVRSSMEVVEVGRAPTGLPVYCDAAAAAADGLIIVNRIKEHTDFEAKYESGLVKMMVIGLGKQKGAATLHNLGVRGFREEMARFAEVAIANTPLLFGIGIVENAFNRPAILEVVDRDSIFEREAMLLREAKRLSPGILVDELDVLVVEEMGKDISGTGMDANVIGRRLIFGEEEPASPRYTRIVVLSLSENSHGNAVGIGLADVCSRRLTDRIDLESTYINTITATSIERVKIPLTAETDREAIEIALKTCWVSEHENARMAVIRNTKALETVWFSEGMLPTLQGRDDLQITGPPTEMRFDEDDNLIACRKGTGNE